MANHAILIQNSVQAQNIDALNRSVKGSADIDNGNVFNLLTLSSVAGEGEVWIATAVDSAIKNIWMAAEPEVVMTGNYKGLDPDVRNFYNKSGDVFTAFKVKVGDIITLTAEAMSNAKSTNTYVIPKENEYKLLWANAAGSGAALKLIATEYISIGTGLPTTQRVTAYKFEVVAE